MISVKIAILSMLCFMATTTPSGTISPRVEHVYKQADTLDRDFKYIGDKADSLYNVYSTR